MDDRNTSTNIFYEETPRVRFFVITEPENIVIRLGDGERVITMSRRDVEDFVTIIQRWLGYGR